MPDLPVNHYRGRDGASLVYRELGDGRPVVLIHGFFSTAYVNWIRYGHAKLLADSGFRVIMPDLRAHGGSDKTHDPQHYPRDVLADDAFGLIEQLGLTDYDLGGYSLGARTTVRMLVRGAQPGRAVVAGMGLGGITGVEKRNEFFACVFDGLGTHERGSEERAQETLDRIEGPEKPAAIALHARFLLDNGRAPDALALLKSAAANGTLPPRGLRLLVDAALATGDTRTALATLPQIARTQSIAPEDQVDLDTRTYAAALAATPDGYQLKWVRRITS